MSNLLEASVGDKTPSDEKLVTAFLESGDGEAVELLIRRYSVKLRRLVISLVGRDDSLVCDVEQEVLVTLVRRLAQFRGQSRFSTFFYRVARNRTIDLMRSRRRYRQRVLPIENPDLSPGRDRSPEELVMRGENVEIVRRALGRLSPQDRYLLYLKDAEGERVEDLADMTGLPPGTIKSRLARSRAKMALALKELGCED